MSDRGDEGRATAPMAGPTAVPRRDFLRSSALAAAIVSLGARPHRLFVDTLRRRGQAALARGSRAYELIVNRLSVNITGRHRTAVALNGSIPGPLLRFREGEEVTIQVTNRLDEDTSVHWHGLLVPAGMDGVPGFSYPGIRPGETFTYRFPLRQSGTYWYHSHSGGQEQRGLYAPLIIDPAGPEPHRYDREYVIMLSDWTDENPQDVLRNLKGDNGYYNYAKRTVPGFFRDLFRSPGAAIRDRTTWGRMRMDPTDIADVSRYTFLLNGRTATQNWSALFSPGERVRLRIINAAAMTYFDLKIPGLTLTVVQADGQDVEPVAVDELRIAIAETYDITVEPEAGRTYTIFAQSLDRTGYARGTLAERDGLTAAIPPLDPRPVRTMPGMADMGAMKMDTAAMPAMPAMSGLPAAASSMGCKLSYADLRALVPNADTRPPETEVVLRLTGDMQRYFWTINDRKLSQSSPIRLRRGQRVRFKLVNETMMEHPMHLHGVFVELQNGQGAAHAPRKHTISVPPFETVVADLTHQEAGAWAFHCHLLFHMMTGMFVKVLVSDDGPPATASTEGKR